MAARVVASTVKASRTMRLLIASAFACAARPDVKAGLLANGQAVVDVPPVIGGGVCRIDAERFGSIDGLEHLLDRSTPSG
jgi:hypothetical protein